MPSLRTLAHSQGLSVGNGLTNPLVQYQYYADMAFNFSQAYIGRPIIAESDYAAMTAAWPTCQAKIAGCQQDVSACADAQSYCDGIMFGAYSARTSTTSTAPAALTPCA